MVYRSFYNPSKQDVFGGDALKKLNTVIVDYEIDYMENKKRNQKKSKDVARGFSKQKELLIEEAIANKIKRIDDSTKDVMQYAFDTMNDRTLRLYKADIMQYCVDTFANMKKLTALGKKRFCEGVIDNCCGNVRDNEKKEVKKRLDELYEVIAQYNEYKDLLRKLEENQNNSCCTCFCNYNVLEPLYIYKRDIYPKRMTLEWKVTNGKNVEMKEMNKQKMEQQMELNTATNETEAKYIEEDEDDDDVDGGTLGILFNDDNLISSFYNNKLLVCFCFFHLLRFSEKCIFLYIFLYFGSGIT